VNRGGRDRYIRVMNLQWVLSHGCGADVAKRPLDQNLTTSRFPVGCLPDVETKSPYLQAFLTWS
jgi:hypothetical protein